ncbi:MAG: hypothetical protein M3381_12075 [Actinomycetota bacterium]|nr:hypothetical protein [Actinomycetota bacterium]
MISRPKAIAGALIGLTAAVTLGLILSNPGAGTTYTIQSGYAFDATNPYYIAGYADDVVIATVVDVVETQEGQSQTLYAVQVEQSLKGEARGQVVVGQSGYADGSDRHILDDQPMLQEGHTYLLAITIENSQEHTVLAGPEAVVDLNSIDRDSLIRRWTDVVANQQYPPGVPRR